jgi:hypothetical protein
VWRNAAAIESKSSDFNHLACGLMAAFRPRQKPARKIQVDPEPFQPPRRILMCPARREPESS